MLHTKLNFTDWIHIIRPSIFLLEILVDQRSRTQEKHRGLGLDEVLNQNCAKNELKEDKDAVDDATHALMGKEKHLSGWEEG